MNESNQSSSMPRYQSHKKVWALKIGEGIKVHSDGSATLPIVDSGFEPVTVEKGVISRYVPMPGDYYVVYDDYYKSISPAKAFEEGYTRIDERKTGFGSIGDGHGLRPA